MNSYKKWKFKRMEAGISGREMASALNISPSTLSLFESGVRTIKPQAEIRYYSIIVNQLENIN